VTIDHRQMERLGWERRYRSKERAADDFEAAPTPLVVETVESLRPGRALDLACGVGRNALWLAEHSWRVTAVDVAPSAIRALRDQARERHLNLETCVADLEKHQFEIVPGGWDLVATCYYLQRDLFAPAKRGVAPGGVFLAIVHITQPDEEQAPHRLRPGRLKTYFRGWQILHYYEGASRDAGHQRPVAEIAARKL